MTPPLPPGFLARPFAHRALHVAAAGRPENGLSAVAAAVAAGFGIEIDLQPSADGAAMVFHDATLDRLTAETGPVRARSAAELSRIPLRGSGDMIPTLGEVLARIAGRVPLVIELKDQSGQMAGTDGVLEAATAAALQGYRGPVAVMSFNPGMVAQMAGIAPAIPRGLVTCAWHEADAPGLPEADRARLRAIPDARRTGAAFVSHDWRDLARPRVSELKAAGLGVLCWTVRSPDDERQARAIADQVTFEGYLPALPA
jgi:glycerophosphoryl diester phosphodiesterase